MQTKCYTEIVTQDMAWQEAIDLTFASQVEIRRFFHTTRPFHAVFAGCTSPYYGGLIASNFWKSELGIPAKAAPSSELILFPQNYYDELGSKPVLIALSRSGKTTETILAMEQFEKRFPGRSVLLGCASQDGPLAKMAALKLFLTQSNEETIPQTRSLNAMMLSLMLMGAIVQENTDYQRLLGTAPALVPGIIARSVEITSGLFEKKSYRNIFILGSGPLYALTQEIALKCMEMATMDAHFYTFLETRHGPRALIDQDTLVIGLYSRGGQKYEANLMTELTEKHGATTLAVVPESGWETGHVTHIIPVNCAWPDNLLAVPCLTVGQLVAYHCAMSKGLNPDVARHHTAFVEIEKF